MHFIENSHIPLFQTFNHSYSVIKISISFWDNLEVSSLGTHRVTDIKKGFAFMHLSNFSYVPTMCQVQFPVPGYSKCQKLSPCSLAFNRTEKY